MASSGALRPSVGRVLQQGHLRSCSSSSSHTSTAFALSPRQWATAATTQSGWRSSAPPQAHQFSTSSRLDARKTRDASRLRGVSTIHRSGHKGKILSVRGEGIPSPSQAEGAGKMSSADVDPNHGLWDFFYNKELLPTPAEHQKHGRAWMIEELRQKSWDDLHALWWVCCKERNRISTSNYARTKGEVGFGNNEAESRDKIIRKTMKNIKHTLTERFYTWEDSVKAAANDPEINLSGNGPAYVPTNFVEEDFHDGEADSGEFMREYEDAPSSKEAEAGEEKVKEVEAGEEKAKEIEVGEEKVKEAEAGEENASPAPPVDASIIDSDASRQAAKPEAPKL